MNVIDYFLYILVSLIFVFNAFQIFLLLKDNKKVKKDTSDWIHGYHHGTGYAIGEFKKILIALKTQKPISLHNVEVLYRKTSEEINKNSPNL